MPNPKVLSRKSNMRTCSRQTRERNAGTTDVVVDRNVGPCYVTSEKPSWVNVPQTDEGCSAGEAVASRTQRQKTVCCQIWEGAIEQGIDTLGVPTCVRRTVEPRSGRCFEDEGFAGIARARGQVICLVQAIEIDGKWSVQGQVHQIQQPPPQTCSTHRALGQKCRGTRIGLGGLPRKTMRGLQQLSAWRQQFGFLTDHSTVKATENMPSTFHQRTLRFACKTKQMMHISRRPNAPIFIMSINANQCPRRR